VARTKVVTERFMEVMRETPAVEGAKWNPRQIRSVHARAKSPRLIKFRACIAAKMKGKDFRNLAEVQKAFAEAAKECASEVA